jgi:phage-related tail fiber protein
MTVSRDELLAAKAEPSDVLVGTIVGYGCVVTVNSPPPDGWLLCDGSAVSRDRYAELFDVIGTLHGGGDGVSTFNVPDHRGRFQRGVDDGTGNDPDANSRPAANVGGAHGDMVGSVQGRATGLPTGAGATFKTDSHGNHTHGVPHLPTDASWYALAGGHYANWNADSPDSGDGGLHTHTCNGGGDADTCPVNLYVNHIIYCGTGVK